MVSQEPPLRLSPPPMLAGSPLLQHGSGPLHNLTVFLDLEGSEYCMIHSSCKLGVSDQKQSRSRSLDRWQLWLARTHEGRPRWYSGEWSRKDVPQLLKTSGSKSWADLEKVVSEAFKSMQLSVGAAKSDIRRDGVWSHLRLVFEDDQNASKFYLKLSLLSDAESLRVATFLNIELYRAILERHKRIKSLEDDLLRTKQLGGLLDTATSASSMVLGRGGTSLINPTRAKRSFEDDGGFEDDDEQQSDGEGGTETLKAKKIRKMAPSSRNQAEASQTDEE